MTVGMYSFKPSSLCQCIFLEISELDSGFLFCPRSRVSKSPAVLDLASKTFKRDVSLGGCSLNKPPFLMLLRGSTRLNKSHTFNINQVSIPYTGFCFSPGDSETRILPRLRCWVRGGSRSVDCLIPWWSVPLGCGIDGSATVGLYQNVNKVSPLAFLLYLGENLAIFTDGTN